MGLGEFEPEVWIPATHQAARRGTISLAELASLEVIHGPRRAEAGTYDAWTRVLRAVDPCFEFTDPPFRHSLPMALAFAATAGRPTAVLTGPGVAAGTWPGPIRPQRLMGGDDMVRVSLQDRPLTATAALRGAATCPARSSRSCSTPRPRHLARPGPLRRAGPGQRLACLMNHRLPVRPTSIAGVPIECRC
jgi:hypothetical protein